jgi:hypothetical protein
MTNKVAEVVTGRSFDGKIFPKDVLKLIAQHFSRHEQLCQLAHINRAFRFAVAELVNADQDIIRLQSLSAKFEKVPTTSYTKFQFFHAGRLCHPETDASLNSDWGVAAFMGDEETVVKILGEDYLSRRDETGRTVAHLAAFGGQIPFMKKIHKASADSLKVLDNAGFSCIHFAAFRQQITTLEWLVNEHGFSLCEIDEKFTMDPLDCLGFDELGSNIALSLAPLLCHKPKELAKDIPQDFEGLCKNLSLIEFRPDAFKDNEILLEQNLDQLIVGTVRHILSQEYNTENKKKYLPFLQQIVDFQHLKKTKEEAEPAEKMPRFLL